MNDPDTIRWDAWTPSELASRLRGVRKPWYIVGGWALELWFGQQTREHEDLEFCILRTDFAAFQTMFQDYPLFAAMNGAVNALDQENRLKAKQFWGLDRQRSCWVFDMMIEPGTPGMWAYKRAPDFAMPRKKMVQVNAEGIPFLDPAAVLLFKAKHLRPKDRADFERALPLLSETQRSWLQDALRRFHPTHVWLGAL